MDGLDELAKSNNGFISAKEASELGIQRRELGQAVLDGRLIHVDRGLYCLPETWEDEYVVAQHRYARGIFSHDTSLYLLGLSDQAPEALNMTFPYGYNPTRPRSFGLLTRSSPKGLHELGKTTLVTPYGNHVWGYGAERSLCDMFRGNAVPDMQIAGPAMKHYVRSKERDLAKLEDYAVKLGVSRKLRTYLEVLL
ncbi:MAG: type IV toxin-antitoxin system AbiEi family antitoxin domain-containing protein [Atopobiaceae bacterium]